MAAHTIRQPIKIYSIFLLSLQLYFQFFFTAVHAVTAIFYRPLSAAIGVGFLAFVSYC